MKKAIIFFFASALALTAWSQKTAQVTSLSAKGLSPEAAMLLMELRSSKDVSDIQYETVNIKGRPYVSAFITPAEGVDAKALARYEIQVISSGYQYSVLVPVNRYEEIVTSGICSYIDLGHANQLHNNRMRGELSADYIHAGIGLPHGYDGTGVIVGIIDIGFEFTHPTFMDSTGTALRIRRVWNQYDTTGTAPEGFGYGSEYTTTEQILTAAFDGYPHTHGTHVAGIAAGCGAPDAHGRMYRGIAPAANIVLVPCKLHDPDVYNGILYIHRYARMVNKPCVINMSLGSIMGPHDGLTGIAANIEDYLHATPTDSIILVASASNNGSTRVHLHKAFSTGDTIVTTSFTPTDNADLNYTTDIWGNISDSFDVTLSLYNIAGDSMETTSPIIHCAVGADSVYTFSLSSEADNDYNCTIYVIGENPQNHRPNVRIKVNKPGAVLSPSVHEMLLSISSPSADVHVWTQGNYLSSSQHYAAAVAGDDSYTIGGIGANGNAVISVGSYTTRKSWVKPSGEPFVYSSLTEEDLSYFSSHGPTIDGRTKPDITATGSAIVSSVNRFWSDYLTNNYLYDSLVWNGNTEYYATMNGTSMAAPSVTGVIALWLQKNPALNVDSARTLLHTSAIKDEFTGAIDDQGSNRWGWGKINAFGGLPQPSTIFHHISLYPDNYFMGTVEGMGRHPEGTQTITAYPFPNYVFVRWSDGDVSNPRQINLTSDTTLMAIFEHEVECDTIDIFPAPLNLDEDANCWYNIDGDGDDNIWQFMGNGLVSISNSVANNWLLTPPIKAVDRLTFSFTARAVSNSHKFIISIAEESIDTADFTTELYNDMIPTTSEINGSVNLSPYAGRTVRMAFRACESSSAALMLKNLKFKIIPEGIDNAAQYSFTASTRGLSLILSGVQGRHLCIYDALGRTVISNSRATDGTYRLPAPGVYSIRVDNEPARKIIAINY